MFNPQVPIFNILKLQTHCHKIHNSRSQSGHTSPPPPPRGYLPTARRPPIIVTAISPATLGGSSRTGEGPAWDKHFPQEEGLLCSRPVTGTAGGQGVRAAAGMADWGRSAGGALTRRGDATGRERHWDPCTARGEQTEENKGRGKRCPGRRGTDSRKNRPTSPVTVLRHQGVQSRPPP